MDSMDERRSERKRGELAQALRWAIERGSETVARVLIEAGADVRAVGSKGAAPLHLAAAGESEESERIVEMLLEAGAEAGEAEDLDEGALDGKKGWTPLCSALWSGEEEAARVLLEAGADPNQPTRSGSKPLREAIQAEFAAGVRLLLEFGADPNEADESGGTPLMDAAWAGEAELVELLLEFGAEPEARNAAGETAEEIARLAGGEEGSGGGAEAALRAARERAEVSRALGARGKGERKRRL